MSSFVEVVFFVQFLIVLGIFFAKLWNVLSVGKLYMFKTDTGGGDSRSMSVCWLLFVGFFLCFGIGMVAFFNDLSLFMSGLFILESWLIVPSVLFLVVELFYFYSGILPVVAARGVRGRGRRERV